MFSKERRAKRRENKITRLHQLLIADNGTVTRQLTGGDKGWASDDDTPTTAEVRQAYAAYMSGIQNPDWSFEPEFRSNQDRFDRWLAKRDAECLFQKIGVKP